MVACMGRPCASPIARQGKCCRDKGECVCPSRGIGLARGLPLHWATAARKVTREKPSFHVLPSVLDVHASGWFPCEAAALQVVGRNWC